MPFVIMYSITFFVMGTIFYFITDSFRVFIIHFTPPFMLFGVAYYINEFRISKLIFAKYLSLIVAAWCYYISFTGSMMLNTWYKTGVIVSKELTNYGEYAKTLVIIIVLSVILGTGLAWLEERLAKKKRKLEYEKEEAERQKEIEKRMRAHEEEWLERVRRYKAQSGSNSDSEAWS